tara:strand:- start:9062 stop:9625 length:564 start_codon:yes stop_codon:yes gene_type:complete
MSETSIYLIRHGETQYAWDQDNDSPLSSDGCLQSEELIEKLNNDDLTSFDLISSPKKRARQSAAPLSKFLDKAVVINDVYVEIPFSGIKQEQKNEWLNNIMHMNIAKLPKEIKAWRNNILNEIKDSKQNKIIFTHFMVINVIAGDYYKNKSLLYFYPDYLSITKITLSNNTIIDLKLGYRKKTQINT